MRCKKCRKRIENENLYRCPHCGKPIEKKAKRNKTDVAMISSFVAVSLLYVVLGFLSLAFNCDYYSSTATIISVMVIMISVPFILGRYAGTKVNLSNVSALIVLFPFIANWFAVFVGNSALVDKGGLCTVYYYTVLVSLVASLIVLVLQNFNVLKNKKIIAFAELALAVVCAVFSVVYFISSGVVKLFAVLIIAVQVFVPQFMVFFVLFDDYRNKISD